MRLNRSATVSGILFEGDQVDRSDPCAGVWLQARDELPGSALLEQTAPAVAAILAAAGSPDALRAHLWIGIRSHIPRSPVSRKDSGARSRILVDASRSEIRQKLDATECVASGKEANQRSHGSGGVVICVTSIKAFEGHGAETGPEV
jgi:hypothetical protein